MSFEAQVVSVFGDDGDKKKTAPPFTLVCLPGMGRTAESFQPGWFDELARCGVRVLAVTYASGALENMDDLAASTWTALDAYGVRQPLVLLGYSMGGFVAEAMVYQRPDDVSGLVLISTSVPNLQTFASHIKGDAATSLMQFIRQLNRKPKAGSKSATLLSSEEFLKEAVAVIAYTVSNEALRNIKATRCPVLIIHGGKDAVIPPSAVLELHEELPAVQVRRVSIAGATHYVFLDRPKEVQDAILNWSRKRFLFC